MEWPSPMKPIEQYQRFGLEEPITIRPGFRFHLLLWGGGGFLILGSLLALRADELKTRAIGIFGLVFFGLALATMVVAFLRSRPRGLLQISRQGMYMSHIDIVLPWDDIGPAWCSVTKNQGVETKDVVFLLRNVSEHSAKMGKFGRWSLEISKKFAHSRRGGWVDWGLKALFWAADAEEDMQEQLKASLEQIRKSVMNEADTTIFNVPIPFRFGISAEDLIVIMNHEVLLRHKMLPDTK